MTYRLYGLAVRSTLPLPGPTVRARADVELRPARALGRRVPAVRSSATHWFVHRRLPDGSTFLRWHGLFEFLISRDGRRIEWQRLPRASTEALRSYLLSQVLSFSLLARGREPLHASAVALEGGAVAFLSGCGGGKSSLSAAFLRSGDALVTDDLLALSAGRGGYRVEPGMPRIKLFPHVARRLLAPSPRAGRPMNPGTAKLILPVPRRRVASRPVPLAALYVLARGASIRVQPLGAAAALLEIVRASFNTIHVDRARLARQFAFAARLSRAVPVRRLSYPRRLSALPGVREAVLADLARTA